MINAHRGFARCDLMVCLGCVAIAMVVATIAVGQNPGGNGGRDQAKLLKDATQLRGIHQSLLVYAREFGGQMPRPGLIDRLPNNGVEEPGRGPEDFSQNTTAGLHSACIMQNYYSPELVISPLERNPHVKMDADFNYAAYDVIPTVDCYWDPKFKADLESESNVSYANLVLFGKRMEMQWRESLDSKFVVLGNRGPRNGVINPESFTCDKEGRWSGNVVFNDNHTEFLETTWPAMLTYTDAAGEKKPDNLFCMEDGPAGVDVIVTFTKSMTKDGAELQWD